MLILSDLYADDAQLASGLKHLRHAGHDISLLQIVDPAEQDFPYDSPTLFRGLESMTDNAVDPRALAEAYLEEFAGFVSRLRAAAQRLGIDHTLVRTDERIDLAIARSIRARQHLAGTAR